MNQRIEVINQPADQVERMIERAVKNALEDALGSLIDNQRDADSNPNLLRADRACKYLGGTEPISNQTLYNLRRSGKIQGIKRGSRWYYEREELDRYIREG